MTIQRNVGWARSEAVTHQNEKRGWRTATLGEFVATRTRGIEPNKSPGTTFELYSVPSLDTGSPEIVRGEEIGSNKQIVDVGAVLLCKINPRISRSWVVSSHSAHQKIASTEWITFPPNEAVEPKYLAYYLKQDAVRDFLSANASGVGGSLMRVKPATVKDYPFPLAPLDQQKQIVAEIEKQLSRLDEGVANLKRVKANLKRYKAAVLKAAVEGRLVETEAELARREGRSYETGAQLLQRILEARRSQWKGKGKYKEPVAPDTTDLPELAEGWVWASVDQLAAPEPHSITDGPFGSNLKTEHYQETGPRVIRLQNIKDGEFSNEHAHISFGHFERLRKHAIHAGDIVIATLGDDPPRACIIPSFVGPAIVKADCIRFKPHARLTAAYLSAALNCEPTRKRVKNTIHGIGRPRLSLGEIRAIALQVPPENEQRRIVNEVDYRLSIVRQTEGDIVANLERASQQRQAILRLLFSGHQLVCGADVKNDIGDRATPSLGSNK